MDTGDLKSQFLRFAGADRYRKFVRTINRGCGSKGRLLFWQQDLWDTFVSAVPQASENPVDVLTLFRFCDVHGHPLQPAPRDQHLTEIRDTPEAEQANEAIFPFAINTDLVCPECQVERERWIAANPELCRILRRRTTYEDYCSRWVGEMSNTHEIASKIRKRSSEIAEEMQPDDELWEWDSGGWHRLQACAGVAIVRNGRILKQWCEWKS